MEKEHTIFVDGQPKGSAIFRRGRWYWCRPVHNSMDPMRPGAKMADVVEWARKCCNGKTATV